MTDGPVDPFGVNTMDGVAMQQHEMMESYVRAGFTRAEAITIVLHMWSTYVGINEAKKRQAGGQP